MAPTVGRYELVCPLARGGMAEVYLARRRVAGFEKRLVIKRIRRERIGDARFLGLFVQEAKLSMTLVHQNIVPVFDFGRTGQDVFLAMEFVDGTDFATALSAAREHGVAIDPVVAAFIAGECAQALDYAHRKAGADGEALGVVHRDVTPRNVLLSRVGEVKLVDFGIAVVAGDNDAGVCGTPWYMAPEQARGEAVDGRADLYGLGAVLLEAVSGVKPRPEAQPQDAMEAARRGQPLAGLKLVPAALRAIVARAVAPKVEDRYADAREMATALDAFVLTERARALEEAAPARRLAVWLAGLGLPRELAKEFDARSGEELQAVTFMDDGVDGVIGTATQNSLVATLGPDDSARDGAIDEPNSGAGDANPVLGGPAAVANRLAADEKMQSEAMSDGPPATARNAVRRLSASLSLRWLVPRQLSFRAGLGAAVIMVGAMALGWVLWRDPPIPSGTPASLASDSDATDASAQVEPGSDTNASGSAVGLPSADAGATVAPSIQPVDASAGTSAALALPPVRPPRDAGTAQRSPDARTHRQIDAGVATMLRRATIGARPWAYFYIDDNPTQHQTPETLELAPGRYRLRFENPELHATKQAILIVPADRDVRHVEIMTSP